jgi:hypothetical protein
MIWRGTARRMLVERENGDFPQKRLKDKKIYVPPKSVVCCEIEKNVKTKYGEFKERCEGKLLKARIRNTTRRREIACVYTSPLNFARKDNECL